MEIDDMIFFIVVHTVRRIYFGYRLLIIAHTLVLRFVTLLVCTSIITFLLATFIALSLERTGIATAAISISWSATGVAADDTSLCNCGRVGCGEFRRCTCRWKLCGVLRGSY